MIDFLQINNKYDDIGLPILYFNFNSSICEKKWCISALQKNCLDYENKRKMDIVVLCSPYDDGNNDFIIVINNMMNHHYTAVKIASKTENASPGLFVVIPTEFSRYKNTTGNDQLFVIKTDNENIINDHKDIFKHPSLILDITLSAGFIDKRGDFQRREYYSHDNDNLCVESTNTKLSELTIDNSLKMVPYVIDEMIARPQHYEIHIYAMTDPKEYNKISNIKKRVDRKLN